MRSLQSFLNQLNSLIRVVLAVMLVLLVIDVTWQVLTRFILPQPSSFTEEIARFLLIWISLLGGAYAYSTHSHLGFDLLMQKISAGKARVIYRFCCVLVAIFAVTVLIIGGSNLVYMTWAFEQYSPVLNVPVAFIYTVVPLSGVLFLLYSINFYLTLETSVSDQENTND